MNSSNRKIFHKINVLIDSLIHGEFLYVIWGLSPVLFRMICHLGGKNGEKVYATYQKTYYEHFARIDEKNLVVGHYKDNEKYDYEKYLLSPIKNSTKKYIALDFGCGPGRMIKKMGKIFKRVDGVDISRNNILKAKVYTRNLHNQPIYYVNNGYDLREIPSKTYDLVYTTIAFHHIPIHKTRKKLLEEFYRILRPGGWVSLQMVYHNNLHTLPKHHKTSRWNENPYDANGTNGTYDVVITPKDLVNIKKDLRDINFKNFSFKLAPPPVSKEVGLYDKWIFLYAKKST